MFIHAAIKPGVLVYHHEVSREKTDIKVKVANIQVFKTSNILIIPTLCDGALSL